MYYLLDGIPLNVDWRQILLHLLNLVILFVILYFLLYSPVKKFMEKRKKHYEEEEEKSKAQLKEADERKAKYDELLAKADQEISAKKRAAIADARLESERIIKEAEAERSVMLNKASDEAESIKRTAKAEAMDELSDSISKAAAEKIDKACSVDGFIAENSKHE